MLVGATFRLNSPSAIRPPLYILLGDLLAGNST
jgi:hypothetical protein